ncbi:hypothetical protein PCURB6_16390 [Paenibacillus curdlanolyticus]|nr:hypothetical protein PCURB6_16390 [Paenibacillus curdlanolyticus]
MDYASVDYSYMLLESRIRFTQKPTISLPNGAPAGLGGDQHYD